MSKRTLFIFCDDCEDFPSSFEMQAVNEKIYIECNDCGSVESFR